MANDGQAPATKSDIKQLESRLKTDIKVLRNELNTELKDDLREFITGEFREQYINDMKVLNEQLIHDFQDIFNDRTEQHSDKLAEHGRQIRAIKANIGMMT